MGKFFNQMLLNRSGKFPEKKEAEAMRQQFNKPKPPLAADEVEPLPVDKRALNLVKARGAKKRKSGVLK